ncbi:hypothetical protein [Paenibacillus sp. Soil724D2]|uniref:hypothetical protein n=1 Tax=Paenibacillus sp. (strain Soil724D2) TaxID=1736392 RepID=UPI0007124DF3|nr:hypothetical protein [Paenibacillus sp. Soil724D2]KRE34296.1 hypothetical protein ASG85_13100 [Paenibacillus sp. Soil724D2]
MFTFPFLLVCIISILLTLGWWTLVESNNNNNINKHQIINSSRKKLSETYIELANELDPLIELKNVEPRILMVSEAKEELTLEQHLQKIEITENQIINNLILDLQNHFIYIIKILKEINDLIEIVNLYNTIEIQLIEMELRTSFEV